MFLDSVTLEIKALWSFETSESTQRHDFLYQNMTSWKIHHCTSEGILILYLFMFYSLFIYVFVYLSHLQHVSAYNAISAGKCVI